MSSFIARHIGPNEEQQQQMLDSLGYKSLAEFIAAVIPQNLLSKTGTTGLPEVDEYTALQKISQIASKN